MANEALVGALGAVSEGMSEIRKSRMELYMKNAQLHEQVRLDMMSRSQQFSLAQQGKVADFAREQDAGPVEPAMRSFAKESGLALGEGPISINQGTLLAALAQRKTQASRAKALSGREATQDKAHLKNLANARKQLSDAMSFAEVHLPKMENLIKLNARSRGGLFGGAAQYLGGKLNIGTGSAVHQDTEIVVNNLQYMAGAALKGILPGAISDAERVWMQGVFGASASLSPVDREIAMRRIMRNMQDAVASQDRSLKTLENSTSEQGMAAAMLRYQMAIQGGGD